MNCFQKLTNDGNKEMIIFTIAKQFKQRTLACKSKNVKISFYICTFKKTFENEYKSAHWRKTRMVFLGLNLNEILLFTIIVRRKKP